MKNQALGAQLRALRERKNRSLRALARETGMALSYLSALERGKNSITVAKLKIILAAMGTNLGAFFAEEPTPPTQIVYRKDELLDISGQKNGLTFLEVAGGRPGRALQLILEYYKPGADTGPELYRHEAEESGLVISGRLELTVDGEVFELGPGDAYYFDSRRPHRVRNIGAEPAQAVSVNTPPSF